MIVIQTIEAYKKNRYKVCMGNGTYLILYQQELRRYHLREGMEISEKLYQELFYEIFGKRVKKRALALLEKMDRSEKNLRDKLGQDGYPQELIDDAISYVATFHYIDDRRYAANYIACRQNEKSLQQLRRELLQKGIKKDVIEQALEEHYDSDDLEKIKIILQKKNYDSEALDPKQKQKLYSYLLRKGFRSDDILSCMKCGEYLT
ncbi:MAG: regulatory protein RecX [Lachnospiraceae bacterium]|nr:regulatory protein RecX [Lachnospiraceae bacterium]